MPAIERTFEQEPLPNGRVRITYTQKIDPTYWKEINDRAEAVYRERKKRERQILQDRIDLDMEKHNERVRPCPSKSA